MRAVFARGTAPCVQDAMESLGAAESLTRVESVEETTRHALVASSSPLHLCILVTVDPSSPCILLPSAVTGHLPLLFLVCSLLISNLTGCDGKPNSLLAFDACGVCGGDASSCRGCDGVPNSRKVLDACGVCGGDNKTCTGCDGVVGSGLRFDSCSNCGGNDSSCALPYMVEFSGRALLFPPLPD